MKWISGRYRRLRPTRAADELDRRGARPAVRHSRRVISICLAAGFATACSLVLAMPQSSARADEPTLDKLQLSIDPSGDLTMKTLVGRQFWGDVQFFRGWRIQRNVFTGHYRLIDPKDNRQTFGSLVTCRLKLAQIIRDQKLPPMSGKAVIAVHGMLRSSKTFTIMRPALEEAGYTVV